MIVREAYLQLQAKETFLWKQKALGYLSDSLKKQ
jgi:hypothetical protein